MAPKAAKPAMKKATPMAKQKSSGIKPTKKPKLTKLTPKALAAKDVKQMSLEEKLQAWKEKDDINAPLSLKHDEQKKLSSKFLNALKGAPSEVESQWSSIAGLPPGKKTQAKQAMVKSWLLDRQWGDTFISHVKHLSLTQEQKHTEKPQTIKELEAKYSEAELNDLMQSGGITEVTHAKSGRVKMYIDHGMWERSKTVNKIRSMSSRVEKQEDDDEQLEMFDKGFDAFSMDIGKAEDFFLSDCSKLPDKPQEKKKGGGLMEWTSLMTPLWRSSRKRTCRQPPCSTTRPLLSRPWCMTSKPIPTMRRL